MELTIALIRNGMGEREEQGSFLGSHNDLLSERGQAQLKAKLEQYPADIPLVYSSGVVRCRETANLLYPNTPVVIMQALGAYDFGDYEGKRYSDIVEDKRFASWAASQQVTAYPNGENPYAFQVRCSRAFQSIANEMRAKRIAKSVIISHRMVLESILQRFCIPRAAYVHWGIDYGGGYLIAYDSTAKTARVLQRL